MATDRPMRFLLLVVFVAGCDPVSVERDEPVVAVEVAPPAAGDDALEVVLGSFEASTGERPDVEVHWVEPGSLIAPDGRTVDGYEFHCEVWVSWELPAIDEWLLAHEVGHCVRLTAGLDGGEDGDHLDSWWWRAADGPVLTAWAALRSRSF